MSVRKTVSFKITEALLERVDKWRKKQPAAPSRTAVIVAALEAWLRLNEGRKK